MDGNEQITITLDCETAALFHELLNDSNKYRLSESQKPWTPEEFAFYHVKYALLRDKRAIENQAKRAAKLT